jgi:23S rRNA pseudouridine1911/1915/1917 synthase
VIHHSEFKSKIIYEDNDLLVVNKPADLATAPLPPSESSRGESVTLLSFIDTYLNSTSITWETHEKGLVHRLDTKTSGLVAYAKTPAELYGLQPIPLKKYIEPR